MRKVINPFSILSIDTLPSKLYFRPNNFGVIVRVTKHYQTTTKRRLTNLQWKISEIPSTRSKKGRWKHSQMIKYKKKSFKKWKKDDNTTGRIKAESKKVEKIFAYFCFYQIKKFFLLKQSTDKPTSIIYRNTG